GVQKSRGIPDLFKPREGAHHLGAVHEGQNLAAGAAVTVLPRQRPTTSHHQLRRFIHQAPVLRSPLITAQIKVDTHVNTASPEVPVHWSYETILVHQRDELFKIVCEVFGSNR